MERRAWSLGNVLIGEVEVVFLLIVYNGIEFAAGFQRYVNRIEIAAPSEPPSSCQTRYSYC